MYDTILHIAHDVIVIGGALLMIFGIILIMMLMITVARINGIVSKTVDTISLISQYIIFPFSYIASFMSRRSEEDEGDKEVKKKKASTSKNR